MDSNKKELKKRIQQILVNLPPGKGRNYLGYKNGVEYFRANYYLFLTGANFIKVDRLLFYRLRDSKLLEHAERAAAEIRAARNRLISEKENALYYRNLAVYLKYAKGVSQPIYRERIRRWDRPNTDKIIDDELGAGESDEFT